MCGPGRSRTATEGAAQERPHPTAVSQRRLLSRYSSDGEKHLCLTRGATGAWGRTQGQGEKFSIGANRGGGLWARVPASNITAPFPAVPLENFTSPSSFPSREHQWAGEASLIYRKGKTRFNDVKVKHDSLPLGRELTLVTDSSCPGWAWPSLRALNQATACLAEGLSFKRRH